MDEGGPGERVGALVVSLRREAPDAPLVARLSAIDTLDAEPQLIDVPGDADIVLARVAEWLHAVASGEPLRWVTDR